MMGILSFDLERYQRSFNRTSYRLYKTPLNGVKIQILVLTLNAIVLNLIPDRVMVSVEVQNIIDHLKFLMPDTEFIKLYANNYQKSMFAFTWLFYFWGIFHLLDVIVLIANKEMLVHNYICVVKSDKIPSEREKRIFTRIGFVIFIIIIYINFNSFITSDKFLGAYSEVIHMSMVINIVVFSALGITINWPLVLVTQWIYNSILRRRINVE